MSVLEQPILRVTVQAGAALKAARFVEADGTYPSVNGNAIGVTYTDAADDEYVSVTVLGVVPATVSGAVAVGAKLRIGTADGRVTVHSSNAAVVGRALEAATTAGQEIRVLLIPN